MTDLQALLVEGAEALSADWRDHLTPAEAKRLSEMAPVLALAKLMRAERREIELKARCRSRTARRRIAT